MRENIDHKETATPQTRPLSAADIGVLATGHPSLQGPQAQDGVVKIVSNNGHCLVELTLLFEDGLKTQGTGSGENSDEAVSKAYFSAAALGHNFYKGRSERVNYGI